MTTQQIVVHAGFHKTGTTAVQSFLRQNGKHLWPHMALVLPSRIADVTKCATLHSAMRDPLSFDEFCHRLRMFLLTLDIGTKRHLLISAEDLAGLIPGRSHQEEYGSCAALMGGMKEVISDVFGDHRALSFYFSTREKQAWLRSSYWQNLRVSKLTLSFQDYAEKFETAAEFASILSQTKAAVGETSVLSCPLEDTTGAAFGPATPLLDLFPLPDETRAALGPVEHKNVSPPAELITQILGLNRSGLDAETLTARKNEVLTLHRAANSG